MFEISSCSPTPCPSIPEKPRSCPKWSNGAMLFLGNGGLPVSELRGKLAAAPLTRGTCRQCWLILKPSSRRDALRQRHPAELLPVSWSSETADTTNVPYSYFLWLRVIFFLKEHNYEYGRILNYHLVVWFLFLSFVLCSLSPVSPVCYQATCWFSDYNSVFLFNSCFRLAYHSLYASRSCLKNKTFISLLQVLVQSLL